MEEIDINNLVYQDIILNKNIPNDIIIVGKIDQLIIKYKYDQLDLSKVKCNSIYYYNQEEQFIQNHELPNSLNYLYCWSNKLTSIPNLPNSLTAIDFGNINLDKLEYNPDYKNIKFEFENTKITIEDYIIKSKEDYISYMEKYEKYLFNKVKSARK